MTTAYDRAGSGQPLILIHGLGGVGPYWDRLVPRLSPSYDVITIDLPGFGRSEPLPGDTVTARDLAESVGSLLDDLGLADVHVVGHSLGGAVAFELGVLGRARTIIGLAPAGLWGGDEQAAVSRLRLRATHTLTSLSRPVARPVVQLTTRFAPLPHGLTPDAALALYDSFSGAPGFTPVLRGVTSTPFSDGERLTMPVTVVFGTKDRVILAQDRNRDRLPAHTRWVDIRGASHNVPWDRPSDIIRVIDETTTSVETGGAV